MFKSKHNGIIPALSMNTHKERKQHASLKNYVFGLQKGEKLLYFINSQNREICFQIDNRFSPFVRD